MTSLASNLGSDHHIRAKRYTTREVDFYEDFQIKTGRGSLKRWRTRYMKILYPGKIMKLSTNASFDGNTKEFPLDIYNRIKKSPTALTVRLSAKKTKRRRMSIQCISIFDYIDLVAEVEIILGKRTDPRIHTEQSAGDTDLVSSGDTGMHRISGSLRGSHARSSSSLNSISVLDDKPSLTDIPYIDAESTSSSVSVLPYEWLVPSFSDTSLRCKSSLVHQPSRHSKYTVAEQEKSKEDNTKAVVDDLNCQTVDKSVDIATDSVVNDVIDQSCPHSSIASLDKMPKSIPSVTKQPRDMEEKQTGSDDGLDPSLQNDNRNEESKVQTLADILSGYTGIFEDYLRDDYRHPPPRVSEVINNRINRVRMTCSRWRRRLSRR